MASFIGNGKQHTTIKSHVLDHLLQRYTAMGRVKNTE